MKVELSTRCHLQGPGKTDTTEVEAGQHELEKINNPHVDEGLPWFVLKGTTIGMALAGWENLRNNDVATFITEPETKETVFESRSGGGNFGIALLT